jgi:hypothetical protein
VGDGSAGTGEAHPLGRAKHSRVELKGLSRAANRDAGGYPAIEIRSGFGLAGAVIWLSSLMKSIVPLPI